ncbi:sensor domain-containing diguanylate cyclase [Shewanella subflava]|uniref:diguanylate cyclase n=1 Tax=Shewanella subflava TaxID=2986476 RepID=A0ABT3I9U5_9GAMM|nr:diguanylate cyclase [Shewanella subflava]MCW3172834.1 diguanylate cyclase [Shewanella subflava]
MHLIGPAIYKPEWLFGLIFVILNLVLICPANAANNQNQPAVRLSNSSITQIKLTDWLFIQTQNDIKDLHTLELQPASTWRKITRDDTQIIGVKDMWLRFSIYSPDDYQTRILALDNPLLDSIVLYHKVNDTLITSTQMGDSLAFKHRPLQSNTFLFPFALKPGETHQFLLKINTNGSLNLPLVLWSPNDLTQVIETKNLNHGLQIGFLLAIGVFSLFIALASGSFSFSYYSGYVLSLALLMATIYGVSFRYLWPDWPEIQNVIIPFIIPMVMGFNLMFTEKVLLLKYHNLQMLRSCRVLAAISFALAFILPFISYNIAIQILIYFVSLVCTILTLFAAMQVWAGQRNARLYGLGRVTLLISCIVSGGIYIGLFDIDIPLQTPMMLGVTLEVITMAAVLAIRYNDERKAKLNIQQQALEQAERLRITREESLKAEAESNERLEQMVQERTLELEITLRELNEVNQKLTEQNTIDSLTGVKNRSVFDRRLIAEGRISRRQQTPMALLMLDIDKFKNINDQYGHLAGDHTLQIIAQSLSENLKRPTDLVSRFGGEEFAIILPNTDEDGAIQVAEMIRKAIEVLSIKWDSHDIPLTVSIGISVAIVDSDDHPTILLDQADKALYQAKRNGRNKVCLYSAESETS